MFGPRVLSCHRVLFIESVSCSGSDELNNQTVEFTGSFSPSGQSGLLNLEGSNVVQPESKKIFPIKQILQMEFNWYTSPEEAAGATSSFQQTKRMQPCRRIFPPQFLLKCPKEAVFCLCLLHPEPQWRSLVPPHPHTHTFILPKYLYGI
ncbi:putative WD-repeat protein SPA1/2/3/4 [Helianthus annuus]|nr:putative WD-repeat protein SPA1/2/3/4 [Helianthus annuus]